MPHLYLTAYAWEDTPSGPMWLPPSPHVVGVIDARSLPESGPSTAVPHTLFSLSQPDVNLDGYVGEFTRDTLMVDMDASKVHAIEQRLGLPLGTIASRKPAEVIAEVLTVHADPTGQDRWKPLLSEVIHLGGFSPIWRGKMGRSGPWWENVVAVRQHDYRRIREECLARGSQHHRRVLDYWAKQYRVDPSLFIPRGLPVETPLPHKTTFADNFNRTNSATLGDSSDGNFTWDEWQGADWAISSNAARLAGATGFDCARTDTDLSSDDHHTQAKLSEWTGAAAGSALNANVSVRQHSGATRSEYSAGTNDDDANTRWRMVKHVSSTDTQLDEFVAAPAANDVLKLQVSGSSLEAFINSTSRMTATDTAITGNLRTGLLGFISVSATNAASWDDFEAADVVVATPRSQAVLIA